MPKQPLYPHVPRTRISKSAIMQSTPEQRPSRLQKLEAEALELQRKIRAKYPPYVPEPWPEELVQWQERLWELGYAIIQEKASLLAKTEGNPLSKYCCRQCGECAPEELLEEGKFLERISWLRHHYHEKHPGIWGKG